MSTSATANFGLDEILGLYVLSNILYVFGMNIRHDLPLLFVEEQCLFIFIQALLCAMLVAGL